MQKLPSCGFILISELENDPDLLPLVGPFVDRLGDKIVQMYQLSGLHEWDELSRLAHQLKGSAGGFGFPTIGSVAARLEDHLQSNSDAATVRSVIDELDDLCKAAIRGREARGATNVGSN